MYLCSLLVFSSPFILLQLLYLLFYFCLPHNPFQEPFTTAACASHLNPTNTYKCRHFTTTHTCKVGQALPLFPLFPFLIRTNHAIYRDPMSRQSGTACPRPPISPFTTPPPPASHTHTPSLACASSPPRSPDTDVCLLCHPAAAM